MSNLVGMTSAAEQAIMARMGSGKFSIINAVRDSYTFVWQERAYLARLGVLPVLVAAAVGLFVQFQRPEAGPAELALWALPATVLSAWFVALLARLAFLGERAPAQDPAFLARRRRDMTVSILMTALFNMGVTASGMALSFAGRLALRLGEDNFNAGHVLGILFAAAVLWAVRLGVAPLLAAAGLAIRPVLARTTGPLFSLRLLALAFLCAMPVFGMLAVLLGTVRVITNVPVMQAVAVLAAPAASLVITALTAAAAVFGLREMLSGRNA